MKHSLWSRLVAIALVAAMTVSSLPLTVLANGNGSTDSETPVEDSFDNENLDDEDENLDDEDENLDDEDENLDDEDENLDDEDENLDDEDENLDDEDENLDDEDENLDDEDENLDDEGADLDDQDGAAFGGTGSEEEIGSELAGNYANGRNVNYDTSISEGYYTIFSDKSYTLCDGAIEKEIVINNSNGNRRQVLHVIEVDPNNSNVEVLPSYYQIDKDLTDPKNWSAQTMDVQMDYYRDVLGYNVVGGMNTALAYDSEAPSSFLVWNGNVLATPKLHGNSDTYLAVTKNDDGTVKFELRPCSEALHGDEWHAVSCNFGFTVKDGELVTKNVSRSDAADRSMVGIKADGTLVICQAEGRNAPYAVGLSSYELGETMMALGCVWAVNGDGGGSSQFLTRREGESDYSLRNIPSDGTPRATINGIIVASKTKASGEFDHVSMIPEYEYITPGSSVKVEISGVDASGAAAPLPEEGLTFEAIGGTYEDGVFISDGTVGEQLLVAYYNEEEVGAVAINVVIPTSIAFNSPEMVVPYGRSAVIDLTASYGAFEVPLKVEDIELVLDNETIGTLEGFTFTAVAEGTVLENTSSVLTATLAYDEEIAAQTNLSLGKGSEVIYDFEDQDLHGFYRSTSKSYNYNCADGETKIVDASNGHVRNGNYAMAVEVDFSNSLEAGYQLGTLNAGESTFFENATRIGMWLYIPDEAKGLRIDPKFYEVDENGAHKSTSGGQADIDNVGETTKTEVGFVSGMEESGWRYISVDLSSYAHSAILKDNQMLQLYVSQKDGKNGYSYGDQTSVNGQFVFYVDDITVDYSSAVDDRELPVFSGMAYAVAGMDESAALNGQIISKNTVSFTASVEENTVKSNYSGIDTTSGEVYIDGVDYSSELIWTGNSKMSLNNVTLADGRHEVKFAVCDKMGNYSSIIRDIVINSEDSAPIKVVPHDPEADRLLLGSNYYIDIVAAAIEDVETVEVTLDLNNISHWEFDGIDVTYGFDVDYTLVEDENIATFTIERTGENNLFGEQVLVSIPVRTWQLEPVVAIYGHAGQVWMYPNYKKGNEILPMDLSVETDAGRVTFADGTSASFASPRIQVDTELYGNAYTSSGSAANNYIRNDAGYAEWNGGHDHRAYTAQYYAEGATNVATPVALEDKASTCIENGYTGRTYCEVCESVVDWGTILPKEGHKYVVKDGAVVCDLCGEPKDNSGTNGLVEIDGKLYYLINGEMKSGWNIDGSNYYYFDPVTFAAVDGEFTLDGFTYVFEDCVLVKGALVVDEKGTRYRWAGRFVYNEWIEYEGNKYYMDQDTYAETGIFLVSNDGKRYVADENGVWQENLVGPFDIDGKTYYVENGIINQGIGLVEIDGDLSYFNASGVMVKDATSWVVDTKDLLPEGNGYYEIDAEGKLVKTGFVTGGGATYYYDNLVKAKGLTKIGEDYYYFNASSGKMQVSTTMWISGSNAYGLAAGYYDFQADGTMYIPDPNGPKAVIAEGGKLYFTVDGVKQKNGMNELDGEFYYAKTNGVLAQNETIWVSQSNDLIESTGYYAFDAEGKLVKTGFVTGGGATYYYNNLEKVKGLTKIGEDYYFFNAGSGKMYVNTTMWIGSNAYGLAAGYYDFQADGTMYIPDPNGPKAVIAEGGKLYFTVDGVKQKNGMNELDGEFYYAKTNGVLAQNETIWVSQSNDLIESTGYYAFDAEGKLVKTGFVTGGGATYYYDNLVKAKGLTKIGEDYYFFNAGSGKMYANTTMWVGSNAHGLAAGYYDFQADGTMYIPNPNGPKAIIKEGGKLYFTVDGVKQKNGMNELDGEFYYAKTNGVLAQNETIWVSQPNNLVESTGYYAFDAEGKLVKTGFVTGGGATYYYDNLVKAKGLTKIGENYYFFNKSSGKMSVSTTLWVGTNDLGVKAGYYDFQADGTMETK